MVEKAAARQTSADGSEAGEEIGAISLSETSDEDMAAFAADAHVQVARWHLSSIQFLNGT